MLLHFILTHNLLFIPSVSDDSVAMATNQKVVKDEDTDDSALGTASGATFTGTQFSEVSCSIDMI